MSNFSRPRPKEMSLREQSRGSGPGTCCGPISKSTRLPGCEYNFLFTETRETFNSLPTFTTKATHAAPILHHLPNTTTVALDKALSLMGSVPYDTLARAPRRDHESSGLAGSLAPVPSEWTCVLPRSNYLAGTSSRQCEPTLSSQVEDLGGVA